MGRDGLIVVDKPGGLTSHDVVAKIRRLAGTRRVGHGGTLDPMATGVLILGVRRATRLLTYVSGADKRYTATIRLGQATITDDGQGELLACASAAEVTPEAVREALRAFVGEIDQVPSAVSAIKVGGVRSYARVRSGERVDLPARRVRIDELDVMALRPGVAGESRAEVGHRDAVLDVDVRVSCSSGTYVRAIARDLGAVLGVGGHLLALRRTAVGSFTVGEAITLTELAGLADPVTMSVEQAAERLFARRDADADEARKLSHGAALTAVGLPSPYAVFAPDGRVVAIVTEAGGRARAQVVLTPAEPRTHDRTHDCTHDREQGLEPDLEPGLEPGLELGLGQEE